MKDIELPPLSKFDHPEPRTMQWSDLELYAIKSYARAAIEADRAQRVPDAVCDDDLSELAHSANQEALSFGLSHNTFLRYFKEVRRRLLASTPTPAPAQQEPMEAFLVIDLSRELCVKPSILIRALQAQGIGNYSVNMALPKSAADAMRKHFKSAAQHQEPPQQERGPMTDEERHTLFAGLLSETVDTPTDMFRLIVERVERHYGIRKD